VQPDEFRDRLGEQPLGAMVGPQDAVVGAEDEERVVSGLLEQREEQALYLWTPRGGRIAKLHRETVATCMPEPYS